MNDPVPGTPQKKQKIPENIKKLIWIGVAVACLALFEIGELVMHIAASPAAH